MLKVLRQNNGVALTMIIIITTGTMVLITALAALAFHNYRAVKATNDRASAYYISDYGMEKAIKNIETIVQSAKIYTDEVMRANGIYDSLVNDQSLINDPTRFKTRYKEEYEKLYKKFINEQNGLSFLDKDSTDKDNKYVNSDSDLASLGTGSYEELAPGSGLRYGVVIHKKTIGSDKKYLDDSVGATEDYKLTIEVTGWRMHRNNAVFVRKTYAEVGINPWGYDDGAALDDSNLELDVNSDDVYSSPQWASALASSGDIIVKGGTVNVEGDIFVNGKNPPPQLYGEMFIGDKYGGLIVGKDNSAGTLNVNGNVFSSNYVHTMYPGSRINIKARTTPLKDLGDTYNYNRRISAIYSMIDAYPIGAPGTPPETEIYDDKYSERANNLNANGSDPLNIGSSYLTMLGRTQTNQEYIKYLKSTYHIQKNYGGFVYANSLQIERDLSGAANPVSQEISVDGSAIIYDNLETDGKGTITINNNFYGHRGGEVGYNQSSSIVTNHIEGRIKVGQRIYNAGRAYVTAWKDTDGDNIGDEPYRTAEGASIYRNYYNYRTAVTGYPYSTTTGFYYPFTFFDFQNIVDQITHVFYYNEEHKTEATISQGGLNLDKNLIELNGTIYSNSNLSNTNVDMGYSQGILMGQDNNGINFIGYINSSSALNYVDSFRSQGSLLTDSFDRSIANKYLTLMETKVLKNKFGEIVTLHDLVNTSDANIINRLPLAYTNAPSGYDANYIISNGNIRITTSGSNINIQCYDTAQQLVASYTNLPNPFKGLILSLNGKIIVDAANDIEIQGALVSAKYVWQPKMGVSLDGGSSTYTLDEMVNDYNNNHTSDDTEGIVFSGDGEKDIKYDRKVILNIFRLPTDDAKIVKNLLTSKRGIVEIFKRVYVNDGVEFYKSTTDTNYWFELGIDGFKDAVDAYATSKNISTNGPTVNVQKARGSFENITIPEKAIEAIANMYEIVDNDEDMSDKIAVFADSDIIKNFASAKSKNYMIFKWKTTQ